MILGIPTFRRYDLFPLLLRSVEDGDLRPDKYVIVDNGCRPDDVEVARDYAEIDESRFEVVSLGRNVGVSGAWNLIIERGAGEPVLISNDDIVVGRETLGEIARAARDADIVRAPGYALFMLAPRAYETVGFFDENFIAYFEDNDFDWRAKLAGMHFADPALPIHHEGSATLKCLSAAGQRRFGQYFEERRTYYQHKWGGAPGQEKHIEPFNGDPPSGWTLRPATVGGLVLEEPWLDL